MRRDAARRGLKALGLALAAGAAGAADLERGREVFRQCEACHSTAPGEHRFGPSLAGVVGRPAGRVKGYAYSDALAAARFRWDAVRLSQWLADDSKHMLPGTRMVFAGLQDPQDVQALVAFLATLRGTR